MDKWQTMRAFVQVVDAGGFHKAAELLACSPASVSRMISDLETQLGTRLLQRTTRRVSLTEAGRILFVRYRQILGELQEAEQEAVGDAEHLAGTLRITAPTSYGVKVIAPLLRAFQANYPQVSLDVHLHERTVDLVEGGFDFAVRLAQHLDGNLVAQYLGDAQQLLCASPSYLLRHGTPKTPDDLTKHNCLLYRGQKLHDEWHFEYEDCQITQKVEGTLHSNHGELILSHALAGAGIVYQPDFIVAEPLKEGHLIKVLPEYSLPALPVYAVYSDRRILSARARRLMGFIKERIT